MSLLLDTHILFWFVARAPELPSALADEIRSRRDVFVSVASAWEMSIKISIGKWPEAVDLLDRFEETAEAFEFQILQINLAHVRRSGMLPLAHRDPFDRILAAQALVEGLTVVSADPALAALGAPVMRYQ